MRAEHRQMFFHTGEGFL